MRLSNPRRVSATRSAYTIIENTTKQEVPEVPRSAVTRACRRPASGRVVIRIGRHYPSVHVFPKNLGATSKF